MTIGLVASLTDGTNINFPWYCAVSTDGSYIYLSSSGGAATGYRLTVVDVSDRTTPTVAGTIRDDTNLNLCRGVAARGDHAYVCAEGAARVTVVDVSDPANPAIAGSAGSCSGAHNIALLGTSYVVVAGGGNFHVVDVSNPATPTRVGGLSSASRYASQGGIAVVGDHAFVTDFANDRLTVVDCSTPSAPAVVGTLTDSTNLDGARGVTAEGAYAYVCAFNTSRLTVVDISDLTTPTVAGSVQDATNLVGAFSVTQTQGVCYVSSHGPDAVVEVDATDPTAPVSTGSTVATGTTPAGSALYAPHGFVVAQDSDRLTIFDGVAAGGGWVVGAVAIP